MKIQYDDVYTEDLSNLSKDELNAQDICNIAPILIKEFSLGLNDKGQYCFNFKTENHKYLSIEYNTSRSSPNGRWEQGIGISTYEMYDDGDDIKLPISRTHIWLQADTDEENELIRGMISVLPEKWEYSCVIIPYNDFYMTDTHIEIDEFEPENDEGVVVYNID